MPRLTHRFQFGIGGSSKIKAKPSEDEEEEEAKGDRKFVNNEDDDDANDGEESEIDLDGIDDEEIDGLILNEEEVKVKTLVWCRLNAIYLQVSTKNAARAYHRRS